MRPGKLALTLFLATVVGADAWAGPLGLGVPPLPNVGTGLGGFTNHTLGLVDQSFETIRDRFASAAGRTQMLSRLAVIAARHVRTGRSRSQ